MEFIRLIFKNTLRNPRRTVLTILSIGVSLFLVSTLQAVLNSLYRAGHSSSNPHLRVVVHRATSITQSLPEADRARIAEVPGVKYVIGVTWFGGQQAAQGLRISKSAGFVWKPREKPQTSWKTEVCATCSTPDRT
ncbi:MAG TPA: hypothetical protein VMX16_17435 [Terriglobia bacterium]|nr:hypothetical protein [Terriglobia bacterium]